MPASPPETRASLILRLQDPDDVMAWDEFTELYAPVLFRVGQRRGMQMADAENLVQEVFLAVAQSIAKWIERQDRGSFRAWLLRITHNEAVDMLTKRATRKLGHDGEQGEQLLEGVTLRDDISSLVEREYEVAVFEWAAKQVRQQVQPDTWQAFWLTEVEGKSASQAAAQLDTRVGNIYFGRCRVMSRIKDLVKQYEDTHE